MDLGEVSHPNLTLQGFQTPQLLLTRPYSYLFSISYYGARFKGWAVQPGQPTVQGKLEKVLRFVLGHEDFTVLGSSRTDAGVSCRSGFVQIFLREKLDLKKSLPDLNFHLGGEIRLNSVREIPRNFNLIDSVTKKTYRYFYSDSDEFHPFASAFVAKTTIANDLSQMQHKASLFLGRHDFRAFCRPSTNKSDYVRTVLSSEIYLTEEFQGVFFPGQVYCFEVTGEGFLHHQVRKMINAIWNFSTEEINQRLENPAADWEPISPAPANGLVLWETELKF